jgi:hypothetical protein
MRVSLQGSSSDGRQWLLLPRLRAERTHQARPNLLLQLACVGSYLHRELWLFRRGARYLRAMPTAAEAV